LAKFQKIVNRRFNSLGVLLPDRVISPCGRRPLCARERGIRMTAQVRTYCVSGVKGMEVCVEVFVSRGMSEFNIIGLAGASVREARSRVCAAVKNCGWMLPQGRITVNLAPSDVRKEGTGFDLPLAAGLLAESGEISQDALKDVALIGELSLEGQVKGVRGIMAMCIEGIRQGVHRFIIPADNAAEAMHVEGASFIPLRHLSELPDALKCEICPLTGSFGHAAARDDSFCFSKIRGHKSAKRALEIAAAGGHGVLMLGAIGSGKTMLAQALSSIMPPLTHDEIYEVTGIYSVSGMLPEGQPLITQPPFRRVYTGVTKTALTGGGRPVAPGEISLAHRGILFLDEMTEIDRAALDSLRQPLETGEITVSRVGHIEKLPADFMLVAAANPCDCGNYFEGGGKCSCGPNALTRAVRRISRPVLDRIDMHIAVRTPEYSELAGPPPETSEQIRERVIEVRKLETGRLKLLGIGVSTYGSLSGADIDRACKLTPGALSLLEMCSEKQNYSIRTFSKLKTVGRTVADLNGHELIQEEDIAEAVQYRVIDRLLYKGGETDAA